MQTNASIKSVNAMGKIHGRRWQMNFMKKCLIMKIMVI